MKKAVLILFASLAIAGVFAQDNSNRKPFISKSFSEAIKQVDAQTSGGNISVESTGSGQARVEVYMWPSNGRGSANLSKEEIQKRLDEYYDLKIEASNGTLTAIAKPRKQRMDWKQGLSISFKVFVGRAVSSHLETSGGNIDLKELTGSQQVTTSGGNISVEHVKGSLKGTTSGGNIRLDGSEDDIVLTTSGGNIDANNSTGKIKLSTSGGNIMLADLNGDVDATTSGGDVRANKIKGDLEASTSGGNINLVALSCNLSTTTSGGDIKVAVLEPGKSIKLRNSGGRIDLELPAGKGYDLDLAGDKVKTDKLSDFSGKIEDDRIDGKMNGGGILVKADASGGRVTVSFK